MLACLPDLTSTRSLPRSSQRLGRFPPRAASGEDAAMATSVSLRNAIREEGSRGTNASPSSCEKVFSKKLTSCQLTDESTGRIQNWSESDNARPESSNSAGVIRLSLRRTGSTPSRVGGIERSSIQFAKRAEENRPVESRHPRGRSGAESTWVLPVTLRNVESKVNSTTETSLRIRTRRNFLLLPMRGSMRSHRLPAQELPLPEGKYTYANAYGTFAFEGWRKTSRPRGAI